MKEMKGRKESNGEEKEKKKEEKKVKEEKKMNKRKEEIVGWLGLWHISLCSMFNVNSIFMKIVLFQTIQFSISTHFKCLVGKTFLFQAIQLIQTIHFSIIIPLALFNSSSSSSCRAASTDIPDPLLLLLPIIHRLWQVFRVTSRILTELLYVYLSWSSSFCSSICGGP